MAHIQLFLGQAASGKTTRCLSAYARELRAARGTQTAGQACWLVPAHEARHVVLERLLPLIDGVAFQPNVFTFDRFADRVLQETRHDGRAISGSARRIVVRHLVRELMREEQLQHFLPIAGTEGFLDVVIAFISELKRAEIWPETFLAACREHFGPSVHRDAELGLIYQRYQDVLLSKKWYDAEGRFWLARTAMQNATQGFWREMSLVIVDGFSDFTRTQQEMLEQLAVGSREMIVTLPLEQPIRREELFAKPASVYGQLRALFAGLGSVATDVCDHREASRPAALAQLQRRLFENPRTVQKSSSSDGLEIIAAKGDRSEKVAVAFRIKQLLARGVSPHEILVGCRSAAASGPAWKDYLAAAGIPVWCEAPPPWSRSPYLKILFGVLQLETESWPFERLQSVLNSTFLRPAKFRQEWQPADSPRRITGWLRRLKVHAGRESMQRAIARRRERVTSKETPQDRADLEFAANGLAEISAALESLRQPLDLFTWADALALVTSRLGLTQADEPARRDAERLQQLLRAAAAIERELSTEPLLRTLPEFLLLLRDIVQSDAPVSEESPSGKVRLVGAETLRHLQSNYVFLVETTEDAFPSRRSEDCLYSDTDRLQLQAGGLSLSHQELRQREEMLLFYQVVTRAARQLTVTYSQVNAQGHVIYASPFLTSLCELFEPSLQPEPEGRLDPLPDKARLLTATDLRLAAVARAQRKEFGWWKLLLENESTKATARNVLAAAQMAAQRFHARGFTTFEGGLTLPRNVADLARRYSEKYQFSATELERFASCGFQFWLSDVLKLEPLEAPDIVTDFAERGNFLHDVLAKISAEPTEARTAIVGQIRELILERYGHDIADNNLQRALVRIEREMLERIAEAFGIQHEKYAEKVAKQDLSGFDMLKEIPFGAARDADQSAPQNRFPALTVGTEKGTVQVGGRIDRVDLSERSGQPVFSLIDYKSGRKPRFSLERVETGEALQLALYALAVERLGIAGPDAMPLWIGYWSLKESGFAPCGEKRTSWSPLERELFNKLVSTLNQIVPELAHRIRRGEFFVENADEDCGKFCAYHTVCRVKQVRSVADHLEKHRQPLLPPKPGH